MEIKIFGIHSLRKMRFIKNRYSENLFDFNQSQLEGSRCHSIVSIYIFFQDFFKLRIEKQNPKILLCHDPPAQRQTDIDKLTNFIEAKKGRSF
jgi:hypothetical protein